MFIRAPNPIWWLPDHTGVSLNDEYWAFFKTNTFPYLPQPVYQTPNGTPWSNPIQFQPSGTLPNNLYFDPNLTYRIEIRHGNTQADQLIWLIENFQPGNNGNIIDNTLLFSENLLTNPQFVDIFLGDAKIGVSYTDNAIIITEPGTYNIAPGWDLVIVGTTGTTTITQGTNVGNASPAIFGNPAFFLDFNNSGWTSVTLVQRFHNNGALFANGAIAAAVTARSTGSANNLTVTYAPSDAGTAVTIFSKQVTVGDFNVYKKAVNVGPSTNTDVGTAAYVDIKYTLPPNGEMALSNMQIVGQSVPLSTDFDQDDDAPDYQEIPYERMVDHEFNVYRDSLVYQPKENLAVGWIFAQNPWQFNDPAGTTVVNNQYTADQTIIIQQNYVANNIGSNVSVKRGSAVNNYSFDITPLTASNKFMMMQIIDTESSRSYWGQNISIMVRAKLTTINSSNIRIKAKLMYWDNGFALPDTITRVTPILSWDGTTNTLTPASNWKILDCDIDPEYILGSNALNMSFNKFTLPVNTVLGTGTNFMTLAFVVYTLDNMSLTGTPDFISVERISVVPNDFAIDASPESWDETLRRCQYYYEKSYVDGSLPGAATINGAEIVEQVGYNSGATASLRGLSFSLDYKQVKRNVDPLISIYATDGTVDAVFGFLRQNGATLGGTAELIENFLIANPPTVPTAKFLIDGISESSAQFLNQTTGAFFTRADATGITPEAWFRFHYTIGARIGVANET